MSMLLYKKYRTIRIKAIVQNSLLQKPSMPLYYTKTKKIVLSSIILYKKAINLTSIDVQTLGIKGDNERDRVAAREKYYNIEVEYSKYSKYYINSN